MKIDGKTYFTLPLLKLSRETIVKRLLPLTSSQSSSMREIIYKELNHPSKNKQIAFIAKDKEEYIGWGLLTIYSDKYSLYQIYIKPKYRRQGIGTELAKRMERYLKRRDIKKISAEPRNLRESARFFKSLGFDSFEWTKQLNI